MEFEAWQLLALPLFFMLGWAAARIDMRQALKESRAVPESYFKGLNYLLNEQPDQAIESFLELTRTDPDTLELHFALGALFRRRGELERALRVHQSLIERSNLDAENRLRALYEVGQDYYKAGLLDRAEEVLVKLKDSSYATAALQSLQQIYVLEKEWRKALDVAEKLGPLTPTQREGDMAHYHCEIALNALLANDLATAGQELEIALKHGRKAARPLILLGEVAARRGDYPTALLWWKRIETEQPRYLALVAERIFKAHAELGQAEEGLTYLNACLLRYPSPDLAHAVFTFTAEASGWHEARKLAADTLKRAPDIRVLDDWLQAEMASSDTGMELRVAQDVVHRQVASRSHYQCVQCGFKSRQHFWQCPACASWDSIGPERVHHD